MLPELDGMERAPNGADDSRAIASRCIRQLRLPGVVAASNVSLHRIDSRGLDAH